MAIEGAGGSRSDAVRVGCVFRPQNPPETLASAARDADAAGLQELWLWEDCFLNGGLTAAAIALANSNRLVVGVGVLPAPLRNVACTAMEIATLERAFPGRLRIGVGHGVQDWMAQVGARVASPMTLLREYTTALSALLRGESVTTAGRYVTLTDVRLDWPPTAEMEVLLAATGPKTLALSGEVAAGTIIVSRTSPDALRESVATVHQGMGAHAGRQHQVVAYVECLTGEVIAEDPLMVSGSPDRIVDGVRRWVAAGADTIVFEPRVGEDTAAFIDLIATKVQPLLSTPRNDENPA